MELRYLDELRAFVRYQRRQISVQRPDAYKPLGGSTDTLYRAYENSLTDPNTKRILFDARQAEAFDAVEEPPPDRAQRLLHLPFEDFYLEFTEPVYLAAQEPGEYDAMRALLIRQSAISTDTDPPTKLVDVTMFLDGSHPDSNMTVMTDRSWHIHLQEGWSITPVRWHRRPTGDQESHGSDYRVHRDRNGRELNEVPAGMAGLAPDWTGTATWGSGADDTPGPYSQDDWVALHPKAPRLIANTTFSVPGRSPDDLLGESQLVTFGKGDRVTGYGVVTDHEGPLGWWERLIISHTQLVSWIVAYMMAKGIYLREEYIQTRAERRRMERQGITPQRWHTVQLEPKITSQDGSGASNAKNRHGYRYDVVGHLRFGKHKTREGYNHTIEWVAPHQRGLANALYIPKVTTVAAGKRTDPVMREYWGK